MVSFWYFVRDMQKATRDSVVYRVKVGTSQRDQVKFALVSEYCRDCALYFHRVSDSSDKAVRSLENSLFAGSAFPSARLRRSTVTIAELYDMIVDDSFAWFERQLAEKSGTFQFRCLIDPIFYASQSQKKSQLPMPFPSRKNLKSGSAADFNSFLIGSVTIAIIFALVGYLEGRFVYGL